MYRNTALYHYLVKNGGVMNHCQQHAWENFDLCGDYNRDLLVPAQ